MILAGAFPRRICYVPPSIALHIKPVGYAVLEIPRELSAVWTGEGSFAVGQVIRKVSRVSVAFTRYKGSLALELAIHEGPEVFFPREETDLHRLLMVGHLTGDGEEVLEPHLFNTGGPFKIVHGEPGGHSEEIEKLAASARDSEVL